MGKNRILQHAVHAALAAAAASAVVPAAFAQTAPAVAAAPAAGAELQEVVVTGTRIQSANLISASPVTTITNVDIQASGLTRVEDLLNNLPQVFASQGANMSNGSTGTATVDLHDLGVNRTLVLVNGTRLAPGVPGGSSAADLNMIPAELIERVEVLTGGASSTYGADAVSGVVNFIMNTHYEGVKLDAQFGDYNHNNHESLYQGIEAAAGQPSPSGTVNSGQQKNVSFIAGSNFAEGAGNATVYATYDKYNSNIGSQFDYSACSLGAVAGKAACAGSGTDRGGSIIAYASAGGHVFPTQTVDPTTGLLRPSVASDHFNFGALNYFQRPTERWTAGYFLHYDVNEHTQVYSEFMFMRNQTTAGIAPGGDFANNGLQINCGPVGVGEPGNPLITAQERGILCNPANLALQGQPAGGVLSYYLERRNVEGGQRLTDDLNDDFRQVVGVKGDFLDAWKYNAYAQVGATDGTTLNLNNFSVTKLAFAENPVMGPNGPICAANANGVTGAPGCVPYNPWVPGGVTAAALNYLQIPALTQGTDREYVVHADVTGDLGKYGVQSPWAKSGLQVNVGTEYRSESTVFNPDEENISDDIAGGAGAVLPIAGNFHVWEAFSEFNMPILDAVPFAEQLSVNGGYRYSKYTLGFSTNTYKFGVEWAPVKDVRFRASFNQAVRAPNIGELFASQTIGPGGTIDPCWGPANAAGILVGSGLNAAQCARTGVTAAEFGNLGVNPASQFNVQTGGNPNLSPEKAHTWSYGVVFQPTFLPNFSATVDYYDIRITGAIEAQTGVSIINNCALTGNATDCGFIHRDANGSLYLTNLGYVTTLSGNLGLLENKGIDVNLHYTWNLDSFGRLIFNLQGTDTLSNTTQPQTAVPDPVSGALVSGPSYNCAGFEGGTCGSPLPHWRHIFSTDWATPWQGLNLHAQWRFIGATQVDALNQSTLLSDPGAVTPGYDHVPTYSYLDLSASVAINSSVSVRVGANNVLDKDPPVILSANCPVGACNNNTWVQTYDPTGRFLYLHLEAKF